MNQITIRNVIIRKISNLSSSIILLPLLPLLLQVLYKYITNSNQIPSIHYLIFIHILLYYLAHPPPPPPFSFSLNVQYIYIQTICSKTILSFSFFGFLFRFFRCFFDSKTQKHFFDYNKILCFHFRFRFHFIIKFLYPTILKCILYVKMSLSSYWCDVYINGNNTITCER